MQKQKDTSLWPLLGTYLVPTLRASHPSCGFILKFLQTSPRFCQNKSGKIGNIYFRAKIKLSIFLNIQKGMHKINHSTKYLSYCMKTCRVGTANKL